MTDQTDSMTIQQLGDELDRATRRDLHQPRRRPIRRVALAIAVLAMIGTGTAAAAGLLSPRQVAASMPAGSAIFDQTDPMCVADVDGITFHCTLGTAPTEAIDDQGSKGTAPTEAIDYQGSNQLLVVAGKIAGGCIGQDAAGLSWDCWIGQEAVDREILTKDLLGEPSGPSHG